MESWVPVGLGLLSGALGIALAVLWTRLSHTKTQLEAALEKNADAAALREELAGLQDRAAHAALLEGRLDELRAAHDADVRARASAEARLESLTHEHEASLTRLRNLSASLEELRAAHDAEVRARVGAEGRLQALAEEHEARLTELRDVRKTLGDLRTAHDTEVRARVGAEGSLEALRQEHEAALTKLASMSASLEELHAAHDAEVRARVGAEGRLEALAREHQARLTELRDVRKGLEDRFAAVASGVLERNAESFLKLASERLETHTLGAKEELEKRKVAIESVVKPLHDRLAKFDEQIRGIEQVRNEAYGAIRQQVEALTKGQTNLSKETRKLVQALRAPKTRGRWGEMQLKQVFELAGMTEGVDYQTQHHLRVDGGALRPDAVVRIPGGKSIVVDAKAPLEGYLQALEAETPEDRELALKRHATQVREHVKALASKKYQEAIEAAPDFVVMFIPGDTFVSAAVEQDPGLLEFAFQRNVLIATPTTLIALVKAIAYGWQQEKMAESAREVQRAARDIYDRLGTFRSHLAKVGRALGQSVTAYNAAVGSMERRLLPSARRFEEFGVVPAGNLLEAPDRVQEACRTLPASTTDG